MADPLIETPYHLIHDDFWAACRPLVDNNKEARQYHFHLSVGLTDAAISAGSSIAPCWQRLSDMTQDDRPISTDDTTMLDWITGQSPLPESSFLCLSREKGHGVIRCPSGADTHYHRIEIQAAHHLPFVPPDHRCRRLHGHNYRLTLYTPAKQNDLAREADALRQKLDQSYLNDLPGLHNPTCEMLALRIWEDFQTRAIPLTGVSVQETLSSGCYYDGNFHIWRDMHFESAWRIPGKSGKGADLCRGGRLKLRIYVTLPLCPEKGWTVDFMEIKQQTAPLHEELDHHMLSDIPALANDAKTDLFPWLCGRLAELLPDTTRVELRQGPTTGHLMTQGLPAPPVPI